MAAKEGWGYRFTYTARLVSFGEINSLCQNLGPKNNVVETHFFLLDCMTDWANYPGRRLIFWGPADPSPASRAAVKLTGFPQKKMLVGVLHQNVYSI